MRELWGLRMSCAYEYIMLMTELQIQILTHYTYLKTPNLETWVNNEGPSVSNAFKWHALVSLVALKSAPFFVHDEN